MTETTTIKKALWIPGWYELDQPITEGVYDRFWFYENPPIDLPSNDEDYQFDFVFFNQMTSSSNCQVRYARIKSIEHSELGPLQRIDTDGLDYIFYPKKGAEFVVNAEEEPGRLYDGDTEIGDWSIYVELDEISDPISDT